MKNNQKYILRSYPDLKFSQEELLELQGQRVHFCDSDGYNDMDWKFNAKQADFYDVALESKSLFESLIKDKMKPKTVAPIPHVHCDIMTAYALDSSLEIEFFDAAYSGIWHTTENPCFDPAIQYRIKPQKSLEESQSKVISDLVSGIMTLKGCLALKEEV